VIFSCIVIVYAVELVQQTFAGNNPQTELMNELQMSILNQTTALNSTLPALPSPSPSPVP
jgi:hypothetical protein